MSVRMPTLIVPPLYCAWAAVVRPSASAAASVRVWVNFIAFTPLPSVNSLLDAKIFVQLVHVGIELRVGDHVDDLAALHHIVAVRDGGGETEILVDQKAGEAFGFEALGCGADLLNDHGGQTFGWLVQQQQPRAGAQDA